MIRESSRESARLTELDLLRFVAAFAVLAFHYFVAFGSLWGTRPSSLFPEVAAAASLGIFGVELFFVISGFVILMSVWGRGVGEFAVSRVVRLFPAYWLTVLAIAGVYELTAVTAFDPELSLRQYLVNLTMLQRGVGVLDASGVFWTLWVELRFYVLIAVLVLIGVTLRRCLIFMGLWLIGAVFASRVESELLDLVLLPKSAPYFIAGMAFFLIYKYGSSLILWCFVGATWALAVYSATERFAGRIKLVGRAAMPAPDWAVILTITLIFVAIALIALGGLRRLRWRRLATLGALTYPLYLLHQTVAAVAIPPLRTWLGPWPTALVTTAIAILLSYLVWRFAERPLQRVMRPWLRKSLEHLRGSGVPEPPPAPPVVIPEPVAPTQAPSGYRWLHETDTSREPERHEKASLP
ncbi:acyltransferase family protein [Rhizohabitans arisaemae]|uniref:acyltransferase family protein n=1 Tax=Rhizohabitans arisaemae TaxID=2720610 RepID=UPI0024B0B96B|nr:acyltransferase [Rhizohabitans arisaemae]